MEKEHAKKIIEALLYMTDHALSLSEIAQVLDQKSFSEEEIHSLIKEISLQYDSNGSPLRVVELAGGFQVATRPDMAPWIRRLFKERLTVRLSPSSLETLSIIAYKQPITRGDIEQIRGVEASGVMETLLERRLIKVVGRKETIGRPLLYGTTLEFLKHFGLKHLSELPDLSTMVISPAVEGEIDQQELPINLEGEESVPVMATVDAESTSLEESTKETEPTSHA
ncbi:MAG: Segregation and condensation protein B [Elusimicrobia bacterium]|nr:Segregation and condensation protein B [Elusimicrobiota bacterium]